MSRPGSNGLSRRFVLGALAGLPALPGLLAAASPAEAQITAPLASWNDGPAKQAILAFIKATTDASSETFVPAEERIATFDQDGTLWVEHPIYTQLVYCLDRVPAVVKEKPALAKDEPFRTVLSGDFAKIAGFSMHDFEAILVATLTGMSVEDFAAELLGFRCARQGGSARAAHRMAGVRPSEYHRPLKPRRGWSLSAMNLLWLAWPY